MPVTGIWQAASVIGDDPAMCRFLSSIVRAPVRPTFPHSLEKS